MKKLRLVPTSKVETDPAILQERPVKLPGWTLGYRSATPIGDPTIVETQNAMLFADAFNDSAPYWKADIVAYVDARTEWGEKASQITAATGYATQTAYNVASAMRHVAQPERELAPTFAHARVVAKLGATEQRRWLKRATAHNWTLRELDQELKASQKRGVLRGGAKLEGMFKVWLADFPWKYRQAQPSKVSAQSHYPGLTVQQGIKMGSMIEAHATKHAVLFFWVTAPMLYYASDPLLGPDPYRIIRAWGFEPKSGGVWDKVEHTFGHYLSIRHEHLIIATRGNCTPDHPTPMIDSVFTERKSRVHSEKPEVVHKMIERLYDGERCEMFARCERKGWTCYGNQVGAVLDAERAG